MSISITGHSFCMILKNIVFLYTYSMARTALCIALLKNIKNVQTNTKRNKMYKKLIIIAGLCLTNTGWGQGAQYFSGYYSSQLLSHPDKAITQNLLNFLQETKVVDVSQTESQPRFNQDNKSAMVFGLIHGYNTMSAKAANIPDEAKAMIAAYDQQSKDLSMGVDTSTIAKAQKILSDFGHSKSAEAFGSFLSVLSGEISPRKGCELEGNINIDNFRTSSLEDLKSFSFSDHYVTNSMPHALALDTVERLGTKKQLQIVTKATDLMKSFCGLERKKAIAIRESVENRIAFLELGDDVLIHLVNSLNNSKKSDLGLDIVNQLRAHKTTVTSITSEEVSTKAAN